MTKCGKTCCDMRNVSLYVNYDELKKLFGENIDPENFREMGIKTHNARWVYSIDSKCFCGKFDGATRKCTIYDSRPISCREFPFLVKKGAIMINSGCSFARGTLEYKKLVEMGFLYGKVILKRRVFGEHTQAN